MNNYIEYQGKIEYVPDLDAALALLQSEQDLYNKLRPAIDRLEALEDEKSNMYYRMKELRNILLTLQQHIENGRPVYALDLLSLTLEKVNKWTQEENKNVLC